MVPRPSQTGPATRWHLLAAACAWVLPGLGHLMIGQRQRGLILGVSIGSLWLAGLLIGGISAIEHRDQNGRFRAWFLGQMLMAPSLPVAWYLERERGLVAVETASAPGRLELPRETRTGYSRVPLPDDPHPRFQPSYGRVNEQGVLYTALAGMLNLLTIIDVLYRDPQTVTRQSGTDHRAARAGATP